MFAARLAVRLVSLAMEVTGLTIVSKDDDDDSVRIGSVLFGSVLFGSVLFAPIGS